MNTSPVVRTLGDLVRIPSVNPAFEGGTSEAGVADYVARFCRDRGLEVRLQEVFPGRSNVLARRPGKTSRRLLFEAHMDTVTAAGMTIPPFEPRIEGGRLYGRGACDTKAGLAAMLHAVAAVERPPCDVWIAAVVDEEHAFRGVLKLCEGLKADVAIVSEPTGMRLVSASKGVLRWKIRCRGRAAHSSKPHLGDNAITRMARVVLALENDTAALGRASHPLVGSPTLSVGLIQGGTQVNIVPDACTISVDRRLIPGEDPVDVRRHYERLLAPLGAEMDPPMLEDPALETPLDAAVVRLARELLGDPVGVPYGSDASKLSRAGIPSILVGPGSIDQAHTADEYVDLAQVERSFEFYREMMSRFE